MAKQSDLSSKTEGKCFSFNESLSKTLLISNGGERGPFQGVKC
jgi:hypothetical protein